MEEQAFLNAIASEPLEHDCRLVYADWLDDHGQTEKAEFLRLEARFAAAELDKPTERRFTELSQATELSWREVVGWRFDVILEGYHPFHKISLIHVVREITGLGLKESKDLVEALKPLLLQSHVLREQAIRSVRQCREVLAVASIEPSTGERVRPEPTPALGLRISLDWCDPSRVQEVAQQVHALTRIDLGRVRELLRQLPQVFWTVASGEVSPIVQQFDPKAVRFTIR